MTHETKEVQKGAESVQAQLISQPIKIELDAHLTTQDITDVVVSETEENLLLERDQIEANLTAAIDDISARIIDKISADIDNYIIIAPI